jgi:hypothetical protein
MGLGCGPVCAFLVGGIHGQWDNIVAGEAIDQIAIAEPLAKPGETVCSPQAWEHLRCIGRYSSERESVQIAYMESTVVDISIPPPFFKPVSL